MTNSFACKVAQVQKVFKDCRMDEDFFWKFIKSIGWPETDYKKIKIRLLKELNPEESTKYRNIIDKLECVLDNSICVNVRLMIALGSGGDTYSDLLSHIVGLGGEQYYKHLKNPKLALKTMKKVKECFRYCIPNEMDYEEYCSGLNAFVEWAKEIKEQIAKLRGMDKKNDLCDVGLEFTQIDQICNYVIGAGSDSCPAILLSCFFNTQKKVFKDLMVIDKFFCKNEMDLPKKFTVGLKFNIYLVQNLYYNLASYCLVNDINIEPKLLKFAESS